MGFPQWYTLLHFTCMPEAWIISKLTENRNKLKRKCMGQLAIICFFIKLLTKSGPDRGKRIREYSKSSSKSDHSSRFFSWLFLLLSLSPLVSYNVCLVHRDVQMPHTGTPSPTLAVHFSAKRSAKLIQNMSLFRVTLKRQTQWKLKNTWVLLPWPKKLRQARKPNIGTCMLERSRACATCAQLSQFFWPG